MRKNRYWMWFALAIFLAALAIGIMTGLFKIDPIAQFLVFVFVLVIIALLAVVGAVFLGMVITHRALASETFTPFEESTMTGISEIRKDVKELRKEIEEMKRILEDRK